ncbi:hypothetical protein J4429_03650 [Candidatus Pacearchaeota archaeon]|nr:hypothetical protein [Candidatus Pacearchaeota archaeon]
MKKILLFLCVVLILIKLINADVYIGTCEGYIYNTENQNISDARVTVTVNECSVGCARETTSEESGYYVTANLNLPKLSMLTVYAEKDTVLGLESGIAYGVSNEFQAAEVNVRLCLPPIRPFLTDEPNSHQSSATLDWVSYPDQKDYAVYDEFQLDSNPAVRSNSFGKKEMKINNLSFSNHIWRVRTCNNYCCSEWVYDYFTVGNSPPSPPILTDKQDTIPGQITLEWESGIDPDNDQTYDEYEFGIIDSQKKILLFATSPVKENIFGCHYYIWRVRTCERESQRLCSSWSMDGFFSCGIKCPECSAINNASRCQEDEEENRYLRNALYSLFVNSPSSVYKNEEFVLKISFSTTDDLTDIIFKTNSSHFSMNDFIITEISNRNANFNMSGIPTNPRPGIYPLTFEVYLKGVKVVSEPIYIEIKERLFEIPSLNRFSWLWILIFLLLLIIFYLAYKYKKEKDYDKNVYKKSS